MSPETKNTTSTTAESQTRSREQEQSGLLDMDKVFGTYLDSLSHKQQVEIAEAEKNNPVLYAKLKELEGMYFGRWLEAHPEDAEAVIHAVVTGKKLSRKQETTAPVSPESTPAPTPETEQSQEGLPFDFDDYDYDDAVAQSEQNARLAPVREEAQRRLGIGTYVAAAPLAAYARMTGFFEGMKARRQDKLEAKMEGLNEGQRIAFMEERDKKRARYATIAGVAIMAATTVWAGFKWKYAIETGSGSGAAQSLADQGGNAGGAPKDVPQDTPNTPPKVNGSEALEQAVLKQYNSSDSSFYDYAHKSFRGDFGPGLTGSDKDGAMGFGFTDWMSRNKHEPNGLGNLVSGLKLDGHGDSMADRNNFADFLNGNKKEQLKYDLMVQEALRDPKQFKVETINITTPYDTTYMVDKGGDPMIATQKYVDHGGTAFKITNAKTGEVTYWRKDCGAYQQIWPRERVVQQTYTAPRQQYHQQPARVVQEQPQRVVPERPRVIIDENPPVDNPTPPEGNPENPNPPVPEQKNEAFNPDNHVAEQIRQNGELVGSGPLESRESMTRPSANYSRPSTVVENDNTPAPDARPAGTSGLRGANKPAVESGSTAASGESGSVGE